MTLANYLAAAESRQYLHFKAMEEAEACHYFFAGCGFESLHKGKFFALVAVDILDGLAKHVFQWSTKSFLPLKLLTNVLTERLIYLHIQLDLCCFARIFWLYPGLLTST